MAGGDVDGIRTTQENAGGGVESPSGDMGDILPLKKKWKKYLILASFESLEFDDCLGC